MKKPSFKLLIFPLVLFFGCRKEIGQQEFPTDSTEGRNVFGCYVDSKMLLPCRPGGVADNSSAVSKSNGWQEGAGHFTISIAVTNNCDKSFLYGRFIHVNFDSVAIATGMSYKLGSNYGTDRNKVSCLYSEDLQDFGSDSSLAGDLVVTYFDEDKRILSGKFEATLHDIHSSKVVQVTTGKFDVKF